MTPTTENMGRSELVKALMEMTADLAKERAISAHFLKERDSAVITAHLESARLKAESTIDRGIIARLFKERDEILTARESPFRHIVLSSYIGEYTSEFLDAKSDFQRTSLPSSVRWMTKNMWDSGAGLSCEVKVKVIRKMLAYYGFVFRDRGEGTGTRRGSQMLGRWNSWIES